MRSQVAMTLSYQARPSALSAVGPGTMRDRNAV